MSAIANYHRKIVHDRMQAEQTASRNANGSFKLCNFTSKCIIVRMTVALLAAEGDGLSFLPASSIFYVSKSNNSTSFKSFRRVFTLLHTLPCFIPSFGFAEEQDYVDKVSL